MQDRNFHFFALFAMVQLRALSHIKSMNEQLHFFENILFEGSLGGGGGLGGSPWNSILTLGSVISRSIFLKIIAPAPMGMKK